MNALSSKQYIILLLWLPLLAVELHQLKADFAQIRNDPRLATAEQAVKDAKEKLSEGKQVITHTLDEIML